MLGCMKTDVNVTNNNNDPLVSIEGISKKTTTIMGLIRTNHITSQPYRISPHANRIYYSKQPIII